MLGTGGVAASAGSPTRRLPGPGRAVQPRLEDRGPPRWERGEPLQASGSERARLACPQAASPVLLRGGTEPAFTVETRRRAKVVAQSYNINILLNVCSLWDIARRHYICPPLRKHAADP